MAFKMELYKGGELHYRAARQRRYFVGAFVLCVVLFVDGSSRSAVYSLVVALPVACFSWGSLRILCRTISF